MIRDEYWPAPQSSYDERRRAFLAYAVAAPGGNGRTGFFSQIARLSLGCGLRRERSAERPLDEASIRDVLAYVDARHDCADFTVAGLLRILYQFGDSPLLSADLAVATLA